MAHTYFSLTLGAYDSQEAVSTLPGQLEMLRAFRDLGRRESALIYRLQSVPEPHGGVAATFSLLCVGKTEAVLEPAEHGSLLDQAAVVLVPAWGLTHGSGIAPLPKVKHRVRLRPTDHNAAHFPIKSDWAPLVDLIRRREDRLCIDLVCSPISQEALVQPQAPHLDIHHHIDMGAAGQLQASQFFCAVAATPDSHPSAVSLGMSLVVHSDAPLDTVFTGLVGRLALGMQTEAVSVKRNVLFPSNPTRDSIAGPPELAIRVFHPPYGHIEGRGLDGVRHTETPVRFRLPDVEDGVVLGRGIRQGGRSDTPVAIELSAADRLKHLYVIGKTGSGKTNLLMNLVRQDVLAGRGVAVIDPHGPLVDHALAHAGDRLDDVVLLDFSDEEHLPLLNPLLIDGESGSDQNLAIEELLDILVRKTFNQFAGPVFEDTVRMVLASAVSPELEEFGPPSVPLAMDLLRDSGARKWVQDRLRDNGDLVQQWDTFNSMVPHTVAEHVRWVLAKFAEFGPEGALYRVTGSGQPPFSFTDIFREGKILLVKIPDSAVGTRAAGILGSLVFSRLHRAALQGHRTQESPFYVYVDEFQKFVDVEIEEMIAEARKFGLSLAFAHQNTRQLDAFSRYEGSSNSRLREAIFSNTGTMACLRTSGNDVSAIATEFGVSERNVRGIRQYDALVRAVIDGQERDPFVLTIPNSERWPGSPDTRTEARSRMIREGYWASREHLEATIESGRERLRKAWTIEPPRKRPAKTSAGTSSFLDDWLEKRSDSKKSRSNGAEPGLRRQRPSPDGSTERINDEDATDTVLQDAPT